MNETPLPIPSIVGLLEPNELRTTQFIKPTLLTGEIKILHGEDTAKSPASQVMRVIKLAIASHKVTPVHIHRDKEKLYILLGGSMVIFIIRNGKLQRIPLINKGDQLVIPPNTPHAVMGGNYPMIERTENEMLVIASSNDSADIVWEPNADELIKNLPRE